MFSFWYNTGFRTSLLADDLINEEEHNIMDCFSQTFQTWHMYTSSEVFDKLLVKQGSQSSVFMYCGDCIKLYHVQAIDLLLQQLLGKRDYCICMDNRRSVCYISFQEAVDVGVFLGIKYSNGFMFFEFNRVYWFSLYP